MADENKTHADFKGFTEQELLEERNEVHAKMRELQRDADERETDAKGVFTSEEEQRWGVLNDRFDDIGEELKKRDQVRQAQVQAEVRRQQLDDLEARMNTPRQRKADPDPIPDPQKRDTEIEERCFRKWAEQKGGLVHFSPSEQRALQMDQDSIGGTWVASTEFVNRLVKFVDDFLWIRGLATVLPISGAHAIEVPSLEADPADATNTAETATGSADTTMATGRRMLTPRPMGERLLISRTFVRNAAMSVVDFTAERLAYKFAVTEEKDFLTGTGAGESLGVFTASSNGISTNQDVSTGNTTTAITADGLIEAFYALKQQYQNSPSLRWIFSRTALKNIRKLKDGSGDYLWQKGLSQNRGGPGQMASGEILGVPALSSEYAPSTFTSGLYVGILGDFRHYWIAEALTFELQRLDELYAASNQIGLIGRKELDGMPVLEEAFVRVTLGT